MIILHFDTNTEDVALAEESFVEQEPPMVAGDIKLHLNLEEPKVEVV